jgi:hypothetical protein
MKIKEESIMTQRDIVNELNRMVIGYNITWDMIKYDADRAIMKINTHLGAEYPRMSEIMNHDNSRYILRANGRDVPIFPERYILTVVIPFIATEVLARDEEFTTIYNKYAMDVENGLFDMFQNEYNKVPLMFRQDKDVGVFFSSDIKEHKIHKDRDTQLPIFEVNVYYYMNSHDASPDNYFTQDLTKYKYGSDITCKAPTTTAFQDGIYYYTFLGWATSSDPTITTIYEVGYRFENVKQDLHLYAVWNKQCVLEVRIEQDAKTKKDMGVVYMREGMEDKVTVLNIPQYIGGKLVEKIAGRCFSNATKLTTLILPSTDLTLESESINAPALQKLVFPPYDYLREKPHIRLCSDCIMDTQIEYLYIPYSVEEIAVDSIQGVKHVQCEVSEQPQRWDDGWTDTTLSEEDWGVPNG